MSIRIDTVRTYGEPSRRVVDATVTTSRGTLHRVGWLPTEGWWCGCKLPRTCPQISTVRNLVPALAGLPDTVPN